jgi:type II secretory pathway pseudopilin PulG
MTFAVPRVASAWMEQRMPVGERSGHARGFTYVGLLLAIALMSIGLLGASEVWVTHARRQQAAELEWIGEQFVQALGSYYHSSPGSVKVYPATLNELLEDRRFLTMRRHLRQIYRNPFTGQPDWEPVVGAGGRIVGVRARVSWPEGQSMREFRHKP